MNLVRCNNGHFYDSDKFAINIKQNLYITKKKDEADFTVAVSKDSDNHVEIVLIL